jgi:hypothetical protein
MTGLLFINYRHARCQGIDQHARIVATNFTRLTLPQGEIENAFQIGAAALSRSIPLVFPLGAKHAFPKDGPVHTDQMRHEPREQTAHATHPELTGQPTCCCYPISSRFRHIFDMAATM